MRRGDEPRIAVTVKQQTLEEERRFTVALDLFLAELVRQQLERPKGNDEISETEGETIYRSGPL